MYCEGQDAIITMVTVDDWTIRLSKTELSEGKFPEKADEIVVSQEIMELMGLKGGIGDRITVPFQPVTKEGLGKAKEKDFVILGFVSDPENAAENTMYTSIVAQAFAEEILPEGGHEYRIYFRLKDTENKNKNILKEKMIEIGERYGISSKDIVFNSEYLWANFTDPETFKVGILIMMLIVVTGVLTIYGIYYVSMIDKVQEYGKLRAIGATKRQIRALVFREGFAVAGIAVPLGILAGLGASLLFIRGLLYLDINKDFVLAEQMKAVYENHEIHVVKLWIIAVSFLTSFLTVYCALLKPMKIAARVSSIEAIRYRGDTGHQKKSRRGFENMNIRRLTAVNLGRNKKRTAVTIAVLGTTGILFMAAATVLSSLDPEVVVKDEFDCLIF
ncbi:MAG: FtsX-like permease family protein [Dorea sp.]|jgi:putative ABC transport system permease protein|nr:FtsX-like permease family protein [Dorea sp.]